MISYGERSEHVLLDEAIQPCGGHHAWLGLDVPCNRFDRSGVGFMTIAGASFAIAKFLAAVFLILFLVFVILGVTAARKITS